MEPAPSGTDRNRRNHRWRWMFAAFLLSGPVLFGASNLALDSQWSRDWLASQIKARTTLDASIGGATWSPWNGITVRDFTLGQPAPLKPHVSSPLVRCGKIQAVPYWKSLLDRRLEIKSLTLSDPEVVLPIELISHFATPVPAPPDKPSQPPLVLNEPAIVTPAVEAPPAAPPAPPSLANNQPSAPVVETPVAPVSPAIPETPAPTPEIPPPSAPPPPASPAPAAFIHLENASLTLVLATASATLLEFSGLDGSVPIQGGPAKSALTVKSVRSIGNVVARDLELPIEWKSPFLTLPQLETTLSGLKSLIGGQLALIPGVPAAFECQIPDQNIPPLQLPGGGVLQTETFSSALQFRGMLVSPSTWQADIINTAMKPVVTADGQKTRFDHAQAVTFLRGGTLSCVDARMTGDDVSFLGNATVLSNGKAAGVLRIVAPPETSMSIIRRLFPGVTAPPAFSSMSTPQRAALDIEVSGSLGDLDIRLGKNGPLVGRPTPPDSAQPK